MRQSMPYLEKYLLRERSGGEQPLKAKTCCNLGSLNLYKFVKNPFTSNAYFDFDEFSDAVAVASNALDNIIDDNADRLPKEMYEYKNNALNYRNIGLGVFSYAEMLMALGLKYGSVEALELTELLFSNMMGAAIASNIQRGEEKGNFPKCQPDKIQQSEIYRNHCGNIKLSHFRNCSLISLAPCGSIATMLGYTGGAEPVFSFDYIRRTDNLADSYTMGNKAVDDYYRITGNNDFPDYFVDSSQIPWHSRIDTQAIIQDHVDTAISSTVNLPQETTKEEIEQLYLYAWQRGLKGVTIFRSGCKRLGILIDNSSNNASEDTTATTETALAVVNNQVPEDEDLPRGYIVDAIDDDSAIILMRNLMTGCGHLYITAKFDPVTGDLLEIFPNKGSSGGCICTMTGLTRQTSTSARAGVPIEAIIDQFKSCPPCPSYAVRSSKYHDTAKGSSCPVAIGFALEDMHKVVMERIGNDEDMEDFEADSYRVETHYADILPTREEAESITESDPVVDESHTEQEWLDMGRCPICHEPLQHVGGCLTCQNDGYSKCD